MRGGAIRLPTSRAAGLTETAYSSLLLRHTAYHHRQGSPFLAGAVCRILPLHVTGFARTVIEAWAWRPHAGSVLSIHSLSGPGSGEYGGVLCGQGGRRGTLQAASETFPSVALLCSPVAAPVYRSKQWIAAPENRAIRDRHAAASAHNEARSFELTLQRCMHRWSVARVRDAPWPPQVRGWARPFMGLQRGDAGSWQCGYEGTASDV